MGVSKFKYFVYVTKWITKDKRSMHSLWWQKTKDAHPKAHALYIHCASPLGSPVWKTCFSLLSYFSQCERETIIYFIFSFPVFPKLFPVIFGSVCLASRLASSSGTLLLLSCHQSSNAINNILSNGNHIGFFFIFYS